MTQVTPDARPAPDPSLHPWPALWALCLGFFMILVDMTIVSVATPALIQDLQADVNAVVWVTSAYLLAYAGPVLITGRLGDRFGQKRLYLTGLAVFTLSSLWCGLTGSVEWLVIARVFQGLGAAMMTPQTMAIITRIFPAAERGKAMGLWGATAGVATLVGPLLGGILVDALGWEWIFFINVPVGIVGFVLAWRLVPHLETHPHKFDWIGVALSGVGMVALVFGIQEGHQYDWSTITGWVSVPLLIGVGLVLLVAFVIWQFVNKAEPLVPMVLFRDRNFSLANVAISSMGLAVTAMGFPIMLYAQLVRGLTPTKAALLLVPMAIMSIVLAQPVGRLTDRVHPRWLAGFGFLAVMGSFLWLSRVMTPTSATWQILLPMALLGIGSAFVWAPTSATATRNLPLYRAGAGAGVYNATRQVGSVLGSAAIAVLIDSRLAANGLQFSPGEGSAASGGMPAQVVEPFSRAMAESMLLPALILVIGLVASLAYARPRHLSEQAPVTDETAAPAPAPSPAP